MSFLRSMITTAAASALIAGCTGIPYDPAANLDSTPPAIGVRVEGQHRDSVYKPNPDPTDTQCLPKKSDFCPDIRIAPVEVGAQVLGTPIVSVRIHEYGAASVVATAQDSGSGIRSIKLICQRQVFYNWNPSSQTESNTVVLPEVSQQTNQINNGRVPETGILQKILHMRTQMLFQNATGTMTRGHRVHVTCSAEASNFNGFTIYSKGIVIVAQDRSIQP